MARRLSGTPDGTPVYWPHVAGLGVVLLVVGVLTAGQPTNRSAPSAAAGVRGSGPSPTDPEGQLPVGTESADVLSAALTLVEARAVEESAPRAGEMAQRSSPVGPETLAPGDPPAAPDAPTDPAAELNALLAPTLQQLSLTVGPILSDGAVAASPAASAIGPLLRPACATLGVAIVAAALAGGAAPPLPVSTATATVPVLITCSAAFDDGPLDPSLSAIDEAAAPTVEDDLRPVLDEAGRQLEPLRQALGPALRDICANAALLGGVEDSQPGPLDRVSLTGLVCSGRTS